MSEEQQSPPENEAFSSEDEISETAKKLAGSKRTIEEVLTGEAFRNVVRQALPRHLHPDRFIRVSLTAAKRIKNLQKCTPASFLSCLIELSAMGLEPNGKQAHLIPYENRKTHEFICTLIVDYKGIVELVRRSGEIANIHCDIVYEGDDFDYTYGSGAFLKHKPNLALDHSDKNAKRIAAYSFVQLKDGSEDFIVWGMSQVNAIRKRSKTPNDGPWVTDYDEMGKKSVFRNHSKWLPVSQELKDKIERDDAPIDITGFEVIEPETQKEPQKSEEERKLDVVHKLVTAGDIDGAAKMAKEFGIKIDLPPQKEKVPVETTSEPTRKPKASDIV